MAGPQEFDKKSGTFHKRYRVDTGSFPEQAPDFEKNILDIYQDRAGTVWFSGPGLASFQSDDLPIKFYRVDPGKYLKNIEQDDFGTSKTTGFFIIPGRVTIRVTISVHFRKVTGPFIISGVTG